VGAGVQELPTQDHNASADHPNSSTEQLIERAEALTLLNKLVDAADTYRLALAREPNNPECLLRLSHTLMQMNCHEESYHHAQHFLRVVDDVALGYVLAGRAARETGRWQEARLYLLRASELDPSHLFARVLCCMSVFTVCMDQAETESLMRTYAAELDQLVQYSCFETAEQTNNAVDGIGALPPFFLPYLGGNVKDLQTKYGSWICAIMAAKYPQFTHSLPQHASHKKIRIGIISHYFHTHSNWKIPINGWLEQLDRQIFSLHCFHTGDISDQATELARSLADSFLQCSDIEKLALNIYGQNFDVLIYPGIGMDSVTLTLSALRLAPVQCASWGHPVTTGMPTIDYYLSSELMEPLDGDSHYSENLIRLPNLSIWYEPAKQAVEASVNREIAGFDKHDVVFLCCQNLLKYLPQYDFIFPAIAGAVKNARFIFIASTVPELTEKFIRRLERAFQSRELNAATYVSVLPQLAGADFAALNARSDIFLDSIEWSGCNTVFESLPYNKPIVTLPGTYMRGRHAYAILKMMGIEETIAANADDYISIAVRLANDLQRRTDISTRVSLNKHRVYRDRKCIEGLEKFLLNVSRQENL
jgi:predicted O-linked N-acetylglucosamine transferase (SPINDLY family)